MNEEIEVNGVKFVKKAGVKKELVFNEKEQNKLPFEVGNCYFIRTVTYHLVGRVKAIHGCFIELCDASWVADSGRFSNAIKEGTLDEVEPVGICFVNSESITDVFPWVHKLPIKQK
jgi:hypothetical protein